MKSEVTIRYAAEQDVNLLAELAGETFYDAFVDNPQMRLEDLEMYVSGAFTIAQMAAELAASQNIFLIAEIEGEPAAYAKLVEGASEPGVKGKKPIKLQRLYSRQKFIGQGLGAALMNRCLLEASEGGYDTIWLRVWEHNRPAQNFYRKWQFESSRSIRFQFGKSILTEFLMQRAVCLKSFEENTKTDLLYA